MINKGNLSKSKDSVNLKDQVITNWHSLLRTILFIKNIGMLIAKLNGLCLKLELQFVSDSCCT